MKEEEIIQQMCITLQWSVLLKSFNPLLPAVLVILCLIPPGNTVDTFEKWGCKSGLFLHVNPETRIGVCCITVPLPKGYGFVSCKVNGTYDMIEKCPQGLYQVDNTTTEFEDQCTNEIECNHEENLKVSNCDAQGHCIFTCICNYKRGYCGKDDYDCRAFPTDCPQEWVQNDCSCKWEPTPDASSALGNATNMPGQKNVTTPSTKSADGESKLTEKKDTTAVGEDDDNNVTVNGTGDLPDQKQSGLQQYKIIIIVIFAVGFPACIAGLAVCCWKYRRNKEYHFVGHSDGPNDNSSNRGVGGSGSDTGNRPDSVVNTQLPEVVIGYSHNGAYNGAGYDGSYGSRKQPVAIVKPQPMDTAQAHSISGLPTASADDRLAHSQVHSTSGPSTVDERHVHQISSNEQGAVRGMSMEEYSDFTWSVLDNPTIPPNEETTVLKVVDNQQAVADQEQDDVISQQQTNEGTHTEELQQAVTNSIEDSNVTSDMPAGEFLDSDFSSGIYHD